VAKTTTQGDLVCRECAEAKPMSERFLTLREVQERLEVSRQTLWRWQAERGLKTVRIGGVVRIRESDLEAFLKCHESVPTEKP
jgi:excisionase family DNA binding protein